MVEELTTAQEDYLLEEAREREQDLAQLGGQYWEIGI
jgi:hypothetical protein